MNFFSKRPKLDKINVLKKHKTKTSVIRRNNKCTIKTQDQKISKKNSTQKHEIKKH